MSWEEIGHDLLHSLLTTDLILHNIVQDSLHKIWIVSELELGVKTEEYDGNNEADLKEKLHIDTISGLS